VIEPASRSDTVSAVTVRTDSPEQTEAVAAALAQALPTPIVVGLCGELGAGKTCFARGLATACGVDPGIIASPTFTYLSDYPAGDEVIHHADLYRLVDVPGDAAGLVYEGIGLYEAFERGRITMVEWWDHYRGPPLRRVVRVEFAIENAEHRRLTVVFETPDSSRDAACFRSGLIAAGLATNG
jgi:tRNA threonylcarbamoyladenosine biosynthesis protein TsaE